MRYKVDGWNNFCRVFRLPRQFSSDFCFGAGIPTNFQMVDWFNPVEGIGQPACSKEVWRKEVGEIKIIEVNLEELEATLIPWLKEKIYVRPGNEYLVLYDFGGATVFKLEEKP